MNVLFSFFAYRVKWIKGHYKQKQTWKNWPGDIQSVLVLTSISCVEPVLLVNILHFFAVLKWKLKWLRDEGEILIGEKCIKSTKMRLQTTSENRNKNVRWLNGWCNSVDLFVVGFFSELWKNRASLNWHKPMWTGMSHFYSRYYIVSLMEVTRCSWKWMKWFRLLTMNEAHCIALWNMCK